VRAGATSARLLAAVVVGAVVVAALGLPAYADQYRSGQWYLKNLQVIEAHRITKGAGVVVAVVDSGVAADHPDLKGAVLPGADVLSAGRDGRTDSSGHGTQMAGIIAARGRSNGRGVIGIAPQAEILPVKPADGPLLVSQAIDWAVVHQAKVISMSFGIDESDGLKAAIDNAAAADVVLIAATSNDNKDDSKNQYPAAFPEVLAVGALDRNGRIAGFSHRGGEVDITAPGVDIPVADSSYSSGYGVVDGTSPATAIVAGAAALIRAKYPALSARQVVERLTSTAVDKGVQGRDDAYGYGELDLMAALTAQVDSSPSPSGSVVTDTPVAQPEPGDGGSGIPPLLFVGIGVVLLAGVAVAVWWSRRGRAAGPAG
jgi:type VII secretion-associated serine protease mycosin